MFSLVISKLLESHSLIDGQQQSMSRNVIIVRKRTIQKIVGLIALFVVWNEWSKTGVV